VKRFSPTPAIVLAVSLALTVAATLFAVSSTSATDRARFERAAQASEDRILARLNTHAAILRATSGLFAARSAGGERVKRDEFHAYVKRLEASRSYPGIQVIGFSQRVAHADKDAFVAAVRESDLPDFKLWPGHRSSEYHPILYMEPRAARRPGALGYDLYSDPVRREAMQRARDTGAAALSAKLTHFQEIDNRQQPGFVLYVPIYSGGTVPDTLEQRRALLRGFVYSPFRADDLFSSTFGRERQRRTAFQLYDGDVIDQRALLHDSRAVADRARLPAYSVTRQLQPGGRRWTMVTTPTAFFELSSHSPAIPITAAAGVVLSLAFFIASRAQASARAAAERAADEVRRSFAKREQAEQALRESSRRVQVIIDALPVLVSFVDAGERYRFVSRAYQEWFGLSCDEIVGKSMNEILGESAVRELRPYLDRVLAGEQVTFETAVPYRSGGQRIVHATYTPQLSERGSVDGFIGLVADITNQKRAEDWQRFLANATGVLSSSMDYATTLQSVAQLSVPAIADHCTVYMAAPDQTLRRLAAAHVDPAKLDRFARVEQRCLLKPNASIGPARVMRTGVSELIPHLTHAAIDSLTSDPEHRAMLRSLSIRSAMTVPLRLGETIMGAITFTVSESPRHYADEDLQRAEDLARRAAGAIENARLYAAAQEAIRVRDEFLSIASHELKTPLTPLQLQLDSLSAALRSPEPDRDLLNRRLETANRQTRRLTKLVENLLDVSRISAGRLSLERESCDLTKLAGEIAERFGADAATAGCRVGVHADQPVVGQWDRLRLEQVLSNLLANALKYGAGKPIEIEVDRDAGAARLTIIDHGIGISAEDRSRIFGRFERAVPLTHYGGMGLGLYIARQIVDAHGGSIVVDSAPGRGATFTVLLPFAATPGERPAARESLDRGALQ
jgi:PAS domain S-box-containing protein